jgi:hypothetical protein
MTIDKSKFVPAVEMLSQLEEIIAKNPNALIMMATDNGSGYLVLDGLFTDLDSDGDARFGRTQELASRLSSETEDLYTELKIVSPHHCSVRTHLFNEDLNIR